MRIQLKTDIGLIRERNEDSHLANLSKGLFAVADGMGGHRAGEIASQLAVETLDRLVEFDATVTGASAAKVLEEAVREANRVIFELASRSADKAGMGTTLTTILIQGKKLVAAHVGDSRLYLWRKGSLQILTGDHSMVAEMVKNGCLTLEQAACHPQRHVLTRALGTSPSVEIDLLEKQVYPGDRLLLCTDGLSNLVQNEEIEQLLGGTWETTASALVQLALDRGGYDNITALVVEV